MKAILKMSVLTLSLASLFVSGCATKVQTAEGERFSRTEIAGINSKYFDVSFSQANKALKPVYEKYGAPHVYIKGHMSAVYDSKIEKLFGTGTAQARFSLPNDVYWEVEGANIFDLVKPMKTAHLVYDKTKLADMGNFSKTGELTGRGQIFSIFEREVDGQIVVTLNQSKDIPDAAAFYELMMLVRGL